MSAGNSVATVEARLGLIQEAVDRIQEGDGAATDLINLRACMVDLLEQLERNPGIEAAADDLYCVAAALMAEGAGIMPTKTQQRLLREAALRFQDRLGGAALKAL